MHSAIVAEPALDTLYAPLHQLAGRGATRVYVARDPALDRLVVVKALAVAEAPSGALARFRREVRITATGPVAAKMKPISPLAR